MTWAKESSINDMTVHNNTIDVHCRNEQHTVVKQSEIIKMSKVTKQQNDYLGESTPLARDSSFDPTPPPTVNILSLGFTGVSSASYIHTNIHTTAHLVIGHTRFCLTSPFSNFLPPKINFLLLLWQYFLQARCPSCCRTNRVKALKMLNSKTL